MGDEEHEEESEAEEKMEQKKDETPGREKDNCAARFEALSIELLKALASRNKVNTGDCVDKADFIQRLVRAGVTPSEPKVEDASDWDEFFGPGFSDTEGSSSGDNLEEE